MPANPRTLTLEQAYRARTLVIAQATARQVALGFGGIGRDDLRAGLLRGVAAGATTLATGQRRSQELTSAFVRQKILLETGRTVDLVAPVATATTTDGRPVRDVLRAVVPTVLVALGQGRSVDQALAFGQAGAMRAAMTEVLDAGRRQVADVAATGAPLSGWEYVVDSGGGCGVCLALADGSVHEWDEEMESHPWCSCIRSPVVAGAPETAPRPTGAEIYAAMPAAQQAETFHVAGEAKAAAIAAGTIVLADLVKRDDSHDWRAITTEASLADLGLDDAGDDEEPADDA